MPTSTRPAGPFHTAVGDLRLWVDDPRSDLAAVAGRGGADPTSVVFVHGSWDDHRTWDRTRSHLPAGVRHVAYDRRGHSASTDVPGQGTILHDVDDLFGVIDALGLVRPHLVGHSYGGSIAIVAATRSPSDIAGIVVHEPPVFGLLAARRDLVDPTRAHMARAAALIASGDVELGAVEFVEEVAFGRGSWRALFDADQRATMLANAATWLDQFHDPERLAIDIDAFATVDVPVTVSVGTATLPTFAAVAAAIAERVPRTVVAEIDGAAHGCPISHPERLGAVIAEHLRRCAPDVG